mmetsp:Transcript_9520/g.13978  ORF Transcript_9520/g.13978 Transcript_9520/m.13978 type:complete len:135 (+) Transcript_9520:216-620(+)
MSPFLRFFASKDSTFSSKDGAQARRSRGVYFSRARTCSAGQPAKAAVARHACTAAILRASPQLCRSGPAAEMMAGVGAGIGKIGPGVGVAVGEGEEAAGTAEAAASRAWLELQLPLVPVMDAALAESAISPCMF